MTEASVRTTAVRTTAVQTTAVRTTVLRPRISRHAVHDTHGAVVGYELLFLPAGPEGLVDREDEERKTAAVLTNAFRDFGLSRLGARRNLYVNPTRAMLTGELPLPFGPHHVVLEVLDPLQVDAELLSGLRALKVSGYRIAINLHVGGPAYEDFLPLVDVVKVDVPTIGPDLDALVSYVRSIAPQAALMAELVSSQTELDACIEAGFTLVQGPLLERDAAHRPGRVHPSQLASLQLLAALADPDSSMEEIELIVSADPALSLRVLATVNSVAGAGRTVHSLRQAVVLVGRQPLSSWVMLAALAGYPGTTREDLVAILTRAGTCELLSEELEHVRPLSAFAVGLVSGVVEVLGVDAHQLARQTRLDDELRDAILRHHGAVGALLFAVEEFGRSGRATPLVSHSAVSRAYLHALGRALETVDTVLGEPD